MSTEKLPTRIDCRVDSAIGHINQTEYTILVDYMNNDRILYVKLGKHSLTAMHDEFRFMIRNQLPIDNYQYAFMRGPIFKFQKGRYQY